MEFATVLIAWYQLNKRELPWRKTKNAYKIWLSEIILQQTRVEQGLPYYLKFVNRYPTILSFANATEDEVLNLWQGLGYYSRARNMLKTAKYIKHNFAGVFPTSYADLITLTGVGQYTASAISSFSVNEVKAVVDGNVYRVLARFFGVDLAINSTHGNKYFQELANQLIDKKNPALFNQAIMDFGALQCKPKSPVCNQCVLSINCVAYQQNLINNLPVKLKKVKIKNRYFYYFVIKIEDAIVIKKRNNLDIWASLYDFPMIETDLKQSFEYILTTPNFVLWFGKNANISKVHKPIKHVLTHQNIYATFIEITGLNHHVIDKNNWLRVDINEIENYAQPKLIFGFLKNYVN